MNDFRAYLTPPDYCVMIWINDDWRWLTDARLLDAPFSDDDRNALVFRCRLAAIVAVLGLRATGARVKLLVRLPKGGMNCRCTTSPIPKAPIKGDCD